eukprot:gene10515-19237_t
MTAMVRLIDREETASAIRRIQDLVITSMGPNGRFKVLQTKAGGYAMTTTTSSKLFDFYSSSNAATQILLSGIKSHLHVFQNGGHFGSQLPQNLCVLANNFVLDKIKDWIVKQEVVHKLDLGKLNDMMMVVRSILMSKSVCQLSEKEANHISLNILTAFFKSTNANGRKFNDGGISLILNEGPSVMDSVVIPGIVIRLPPMDAVGERLLSSLDGLVKTVVFGTSLAGDQSIIDETILMTKENESFVDDVTYDQLLSLGGSIVANGVRLLFCQKVVHPSLRRYLENRGVLVIERLGYQATKTLCNFAQMNPVEGQFDQISESNIVNMQEIDVKQYFGKRYIIVRPGGENVVHTMMLCGRDENSLEELKTTIHSVEKSLFHLIDDPRVLCGGGCFEAQVASFVCDLVGKGFTREEKMKYKLLEKLDQENWKQALYSIAKSFERVANSIHKINGDCYTDSIFGHLWCFPASTEPSSVVDEDYCCCCGSVNYCSELKFESLNFDRRFPSAGNEHGKDVKTDHLATCFPQIVDSLFLRKECIASAFELCNIILRVGITLEQQ